MKRSLIALVLAAAIPFSAQADDKLSYTYIEGNYNYVDADGGAEADGFGVRGSFEFGESGFYGFGGWNQVEVDGVDAHVAKLFQTVANHFQRLDPANRALDVLGKTLNTEADTRNAAMCKRRCPLFGENTRVEFD